MVDGTFRIAPKGYKQVYIMWAIIEDIVDNETIARTKAYPCIYIIMNSKKKEDYISALKEIEKYR